ncbi:hypothetical protein LshimejAT787_1602640 [Lyophyllum shimeji]|uniref:Uncharacterized protein n=1 Tax=Lyophyllum shimeji TaxID=47721 RepID=A0A9P3UQU2_LYOSH|nr:hypothetical protein LshimejAT787_1602640 [Lyophyllum shimeji]
MRDSPTKKKLVNARLLSPVARRTYTRVTRELRSMVRILHKYGQHQAAIARRFQIDKEVIARILKGKTKAAARDTGDDWQFVDDEFRKQYPPLETEAAKQQTARPQTSAKENLGTGMLVRTVSVRPATNARRMTLRDTDASRSRGRGETNIPTSMRSEPQQQEKNQTRHDAPLQRDRSSRNRAILIDMRNTSQPEIRLLPPQSPNLREFLATLEHDLTGMIDALVRQDLGSSEKLFALAQWPSEELHKLFKEAIPDLTVAQRFMLVRGLKKSATVELLE